MRALTLSFVVCFLSMIDASAQVSDDPSADVRVETVTITGATPQRARAFAKAVIPKQFSLDLLARWDDTLCVSVAGPPLEQAQFLADRISQRAYDVGLRPGGIGCQSNLLILVTTEPEQVISRLVKEQPDVFGFNETSAVETAGTAAFKAFQTEKRPVRSWTVTETVGADGMPLDGDATSGNSGSTSLPGNASKASPQFGSYSNVPMVRTDSTRLSSAVRSDISRAVVIVDARATSGRSLASVADHIAFVSLAQVDPDVDASGFESVLNLFASYNAADALKAGMTDWDRAYLSSLYSSKRNAASLSRQIQDISRRMVNE
jgi:hypothetical protein